MIDRRAEGQIEAPGPSVREHHEIQPTDERPVQDLLDALPGLAEAPHLDEHLWLSRGMTEREADLPTIPGLVVFRRDIARFERVPAEFMQDREYDPGRDRQHIREGVRAQVGGDVGDLLVHGRGAQVQRATRSAPRLARSAGECTSGRRALPPRRGDHGPVRGFRARGLPSRSRRAGAREPERPRRPRSGAERPSRRPSDSLTARGAADHAPPFPHRDGRSGPRPPFPHREGRSGPRPPIPSPRGTQRTASPHSLTATGAAGHAPPFPHRDGRSGPRPPFPHRDGRS